MKKTIEFDFNNLMSFNVGKAHGAAPAELKSMFLQARKAHEHLSRVLADRASRVGIGLEWAMLPLQDAKILKEVEKFAGEVSAEYESVIFLGIGGSYLGLKAAQDALCPAYYNEFSRLRKGRPRIYFEGNNLDPDTLSALLSALSPRKTFVVVISKSGETTETKAGFAVVENWLKKHCGKNYGRQIAAITDPSGGSLRAKVNAAAAKDALSFRNFPLLHGVGGRYSEFNMGLLHAALAGISLKQLLAGAAGMRERCSLPDPSKNPAYMYALLHTLLYRKKGKKISILLPFAESLRATADWYCQLLAESTGKKYARKIVVNGKTEQWLRDFSRKVNLGRTPVAARGTNDLHSIQQNNIEGENDKTVTFIKLDKFSSELKVTGTGDFLAGKTYTELIHLAQEATEWALVKEQRPNCSITLPRADAYSWGALLFFFEMATAFEGELLNINAFDQPGVEGYKNYMYYKLKKPGIPKEISEEIRKSPLVKNKAYIL